MHYGSGGGQPAHGHGRSHGGGQAATDHLGQGMVATVRPPAVHSRPLLLLLLLLLALLYSCSLSLAAANSSADFRLARLSGCEFWVPF